MHISEGVLSGPVLLAGAAMAAALRECLKPDPDPAVLATGMPAAEATMVGAAPDGADATMVTADPNATAVGAAPAGADAALPGSTAPTVHESAPAATEDTEATLQGAKAAEDNIATTVKPPTAQPFWMRRNVQYAFVAAIGVLAIIGIMSVLGGGGGDPGNGTAEGEGEGEVIANNDAPYFNRFFARVYRAKDFEAWDGYASQNWPDEDMTGKWEAVVVDIEIYDRETAPMKLIGEQKGYDVREAVPLELAGNAKKLYYKITSPVESEGPINMVATDPGAIARPARAIVLPPE